MKYTIIREESIQDLIQIVNEQIKSGWKPIGGPFNKETENDSYICQAMIKD